MRADQRSFSTRGDAADNCFGSRSCAEFNGISCGVCAAGDAAFIINIRSVDLVGIHYKGADTESDAIGQGDAFRSELDHRLASEAKRLWHSGNMATQRSSCWNRSEE